MMSRRLHKEVSSAVTPAKRGSMVWTALVWRLFA